MYRHIDRNAHPQHGFTLVELMISVTISALLLIASLQAYSRARQAFLIVESVARVQETAQFALDTIERDLRLASNWGRTSRTSLVAGRAVPGNSNPNGLAAPTQCGPDWALNVSAAVSGLNNRYQLPCPPRPSAQLNSDVLTVRRSSSVATPVDESRLQIQSTLTHAEIFQGRSPPAVFSIALDPLTGRPASATHDLVVHTYYVATDSALVPGAPALRRKRLTTIAGKPTVVDEEIMPGIEYLQVRFGVDVDGDNSVDQYIEPGESPRRPTHLNGPAPVARFITARVWLLARGIEREPGILDPSQYELADVSLGRFTDDYRRLLISRTILLHNVRH